MIRTLDNDQGSGATLYQLKITLQWSRPAIWRRVVVRANMKLELFHDVIQWVMPWTDSHLHQFIVGRTYYSLPYPDAGPFGLDQLNERHYTIADLAPAAKMKFVYEYDFGDGWLHEILVEKILPPDTAFKHPICLAGANACPPDDCGGMGGYYRMLEILANPKHPEHRQIKEWMGKEIDPQRFDLAKINAGLKRIKA